MEEKRLYFLLNLAQQTLRKRVDELAVARVGLTSAQVGVLFFLARHDGALLMDVARGVGIKNAAISGLVDRIEQTGCVQRKASRADGRAVELHLTAKGRKKLSEIERLNRELDAWLREGFSPDEVALVLRFLGRVLERAAE
ncbi:MAG: MarR family transcriptional regulator [Myxococcaceae bacterium]|nr:MarR family transcriptional regulator [Myxococcaceae bacterium]